MQLHDDLPSMDTIRSCVDGLELERTQIGRRIEQLLPRWQARAQAADQLARLSPETMAELHDAGLLHLLTPRRYGGLQKDFPTLVEAARLAATACASTAWMLSVVGGHVTTAARLPAACQDIIFANGPRQLFATATVQNGTFVRDGSGFRLNGIWRYSSGIDHATWVIVSARLSGTDAPEAQEIFKVVVRREDVRVLDTWHVSGMRATGSRDIAFDKLRVSDEWVFLVRTILARIPPAPTCIPTRICTTCRSSLTARLGSSDRFWAAHRARTGTASMRSATAVEAAMRCFARTSRKATRSSPARAVSTTRWSAPCTWPASRGARCRLPRRSASGGIAHSSRSFASTRSGD